MQRTWEPLGGWHTDLLFRLYGFCLLVSVLINCTAVPVAILVRDGEVLH